MHWTRVSPSAAASEKLLTLRRRAEPPIESTFGSIDLTRAQSWHSNCCVLAFMIEGTRRLRLSTCRRFGILGLSIFLFLPLSAKTIVSADSEKKNPDNRELISRAVENLVSGWNKKDSETIVGLFLPDAVLVMPTGKIARTRSAIRQRLLEEWNGKLKDTTLTHVVEAVSLQGSDAAVVKGRYRLNGVKIMGFENAPEGSFIFRHKRQQGRWMILKAELLRDEAAKK